jgi:hypothetical protein
METLKEAISEVTALEATAGVNPSELEAKSSARKRFEHALAPFKRLASVWSCNVMLGISICDDDFYLNLAREIALPDFSNPSPEPSSLRAILTDPGKEKKLCDGQNALSFDLTFPEVFYPSGNPAFRKGFDAIVGNPPWDTVRKNEDHFFGMHDFSFLVHKNKSEKTEIRERLLKNPAIADAFLAHVERLKQRDRINDVLYKFHRVKVKGELAGRGTYDDYMLFTERAYQLARGQGFLGYVLPSGFYANEGATGVRRLVAEDFGLKCCFSFENKRKLFEIHSSFKFALIPLCVFPSG